MTRRIVAVHAHPDDESITMGGTLAACVAQGVAVTLVTATLGEQGEVMPGVSLGADGLPGLGGLTADAADQLGGYRLAELTAACAALGISDHRMLGGIGAFRDSGMIGEPSAEHPRAFVRASIGGPAHERAVALLVGVLEEVRPDVVLTYDVDGGYGHPDHIAAHQVAAAAARRSGVPRVLAVVRPRRVFARALAAMVPPDGYSRATVGDVGTLVEVDGIDVAVPVGFWAAARRAALAAHRTQLDVLPGGFALTNLLAQPVLDHECYRVLAGPPVPPAGSDRLGPDTDRLGPDSDRLGPDAGPPAGTTSDLLAGVPSDLLAGRPSDLFAGLSG